MRIFRFPLLLLLLGYVFGFWFGSALARSHHFSLTLINRTIGFTGNQAPTTTSLPHGRERHICRALTGTPSVDNSPINGNGHQCVDARRDGGELSKVDNGAHEGEEDPPAEHVIGVRTGNGEDGHQQIGHRQVDQEFTQIAGAPLPLDEHDDGEQIGDEGKARRQRVECDQRNAVREFECLQWSGRVARVIHDGWMVDGGPDPKRLMKYRICKVK